MTAIISYFGPIWVLLKKQVPGCEGGKRGSFNYVMTSMLHIDMWIPVLTVSLSVCMSVCMYVTMMGKCAGKLIPCLLY
jgi:hypothetical protein